MTRGDHIKHPNIRFFFWGYYPLGQHTKEICTQFVYEIYKGPIIAKKITEKQLEIDIINTYERSMEIYGRFLPGAEDLIDIKANLFLIISSGGRNHPAGKKLEAIQFGRTDCISFEMISQDEVPDDLNYWILDAEGNTVWHRKMKAYLRIFEIFTDYFHPIFAFGHRDYNKWWDDSFVIPPPETRVWPFNMYDLNRYSDKLRENLNAFSERHANDWTLKLIDGRFAILHINDLRIWEKDISPKITSEILGTGEDLLVPKFGYPPPTRWWK